MRLFATSGSDRMSGTCRISYIVPVSRSFQKSRKNKVFSFEQSRNRAPEHKTYLIPGVYFLPLMRSSAGRRNYEHSPADLIVTQQARTAYILHYWQIAQYTNLTKDCAKICNMELIKKRYAGLYLSQAVTVVRFYLYVHSKKYQIVVHACMHTTVNYPTQYKKIHFVSWWWFRFSAQAISYNSRY